MLTYLPSMAAAAALFLARLILAEQQQDPVPVVLWTSTLEFYAEYKVADIRACVLHLHRLVLTAHNSPTKLPAIKEKYSHKRWHCVARIPPIRSVPEAVFSQHQAWPAP